MDIDMLLQLNTISLKHPWECNVGIYNDHVVPNGHPSIILKTPTLKTHNPTLTITTSILYRLIMPSLTKPLTTTFLPSFTTTLLTLLSLTAHVHATTWYFLEYRPASGSSFTSFSGTMSIPTLPSAATYYLWPGLQPSDNSGVYQNVLDGRSGTWWFGSGWCCSSMFQISTPVVGRCH